MEYTVKSKELMILVSEVYSIQHYVIMFVSDLGQVSALVSSTNTTDRHNTTDILLKVALNTITLTQVSKLSKMNLNTCISYFK